MCGYSVQPCSSPYEGQVDRCRRLGPSAITYCTVGSPTLNDSPPKGPRASPSQHSSTGGGRRYRSTRQASPQPVSQPARYLLGRHSTAQYSTVQARLATLALISCPYPSARPISPFGRVSVVADLASSHHDLPPYSHCPSHTLFRKSTTSASRTAASLLDTRGETHTPFTWCSRKCPQVHTRHL